MFLNTTHTLDLFDSIIRLRAGGSVQPYARSSLADAGATADWIVAAFHADSDQAVHPDVWERHPAGQEVLFLLAGAMNVYLREPGGESGSPARLRAGESFVVPVGRWHRLSVIEPGDLLTITPPAATEHEAISEHPHHGEE